LCNSVADKKEAIKKALRRLPESKDLKRELENALKYTSPIRDFVQAVEILVLAIPLGYTVAGYNGVLFSGSVGVLFI